MKMEGIIKKLRLEKPLVHHITNQVTINDCANVVLNIGGLPVMAHAEAEVEEMVKAASALVLNIGTLTPEQIKAMILAGREANKKGIPVILDPVGVGATNLRTDSALKILSQVEIGVIKGNAAEISILAGKGGEIKGVESLNTGGNIEEAALALAEKYRTVVVVSGKRDVVTDGKTLALIHNGHSLMGRVVGTGCMLASVIGSFAGVEKDLYKAAKYAAAAFNIAGELAADKAFVEGPGTYKAAFFDELANMDDGKLEKRCVCQEKQIKNNDGVDNNDTTGCC